tara:strand:+ start:560 stop:1198 length:639 start_codon:yes stop_codon:yes gene_type:complete
MKQENKIVHIFKTGISNHLSVEHAFNKIGYQTIDIDRLNTVEEKDIVVIPGVGHFKNIMNQLQEKKLDREFKEIAKSNVKILGICLGMQILFEHSDEGDEKGIGIFEGKVSDLSPKLSDTPAKTPNIGWRPVMFNKIDSMEKYDGNSFYFVHQYEVVPKNDEIVFATINIEGREIVAGVGHGNVYGIQFHPEKSSKKGLAFLNTLMEEIIKE